MNQSTPLVSVVTPFYNTAEFLAACIESVLAQAYTNFEYILLDNCSTDGSREIAEQYARTDSRIRFFSPSEFVDQVPNYNRALGLISPESRYCKLVQADDWIFPNCLSEMVQVGESDPRIGLIGGYALYETDVYLDGLPYPSVHTPGRQLARRILLDGLAVTGTPTNLMVRSEIVRARSPFYDETCPIEDAVIIYHVLEQWDFGFVHQVVTFTRRANSGLMSSIGTYNPSLLVRLMAAHRHAQPFLTREELRTLQATVDRDYLYYLGESVLRLRDRRFWEFQERVVTYAGLRFSPTRRAAYTVLAGLRAALDPLGTWERIRRSRRLSNRPSDP
jgi:glycosyltransferase involved in cell wall biosynthesis